MTHAHLQYQQRAGTLDDSHRIVPRAHIWVKRKQAWIVIAEDVPQYPESALVAAFAALLPAR